jgi:hypothetical protein
MKGKTSCEFCINYIYDEECGYYICQVDLDEDEMGKFISNTFDDCPYFQFNDEYKIVRKQM